MRRARDLITPDFFADIPQAAPASPGSMNYSREIAHVMAAALKECPHDRYEVVARMSRLLGEDVSFHMLNAYTAESKDDHNISFERAIAFDAATEGYSLLNFFAAKRGCRAMVGEEALLAELGRVKQARDALAAEEKRIRDYLKTKRKT